MPDHSNEITDGNLADAAVEATGKTPLDVMLDAMRPTWLKLPAPAPAPAKEQTFEQLHVIHRGVTKIDAASTMLVTFNEGTGKFILWHAAAREVSHAELSKLLNESKEIRSQQTGRNQARRETRRGRAQSGRQKS